jgi:hypothetical protein
MRWRFKGIAIFQFPLSVSKEVQACQSTDPELAPRSSKFQEKDKTSTGTSTQALITIEKQATRQYGYPWFIKHSGNARCTQSVNSIPRVDFPGGGRYMTRSLLGKINPWAVSSSGARVAIVASRSTFPLPCKTRQEPKRVPSRLSVSTSTQNRKTH